MQIRQGHRLKRRRRLGRLSAGALAEMSLTIDQGKVDRARRLFGVATEREAIDLAPGAFDEELEVRAAIRALRRVKFQNV